MDDNSTADQTMTETTDDVPMESSEEAPEVAGEEEQQGDDSTSDAAADAEDDDSRAAGDDDDGDEDRSHDTTAADDDEEEEEEETKSVATMDNAPDDDEEEEEEEETKSVGTATLPDADDEEETKSVGTATVPDDDEENKSLADNVDIPIDEDEHEVAETITSPVSTPVPAVAPKKKRGKPQIPASARKGRAPAVKGLNIPFRTVKKAMKLDPDIPIVQNEAAIMTTLAAELFLKRLATQSQKICKNRGKNTIRYEDVADARSNDPSLAFLKTIIP